MQVVCLPFSVDWGALYLLETASEARRPVPHDAFIRQTSSRSRGTGLKEQEIKSVTIKASVIGVVHGSGALGLDQQSKTNGYRLH